MNSICLNFQFPRSAVVAVVLGLSGLTACDDAGNSPQSPTALALSGQVQLPDGQPVPGARVEVSRLDGDLIATGVSDAQGHYALSAEDRSSLHGQRLRADVWSSNALGAPPVRGTVISPLGLAPDQRVLDFPPLVLPNLQHAALSFDGQTATSMQGDVLVTDVPELVQGLWVTRFDPDVWRAAFPGDFADAEGNPLNSGGFIWLSAVDADGQALNEFDRPLTVRFEIERRQWVDLIDLVPGNGQIDLPILSFDGEAGLWRAEPDLDGSPRGVLVNADGVPLMEEQVTAVRQGQYSGRLFVRFSTQHFSWWNLDYTPADFFGDGSGAGGGNGSGLPADFGDYHSIAPSPLPGEVPVPIYPPIFHPADAIGQQQVWLGPWFDFETAAVGKDEFDDGVLDCGEQPLTIRINNFAGERPVYLNAVIDYNADGDFADPGEWVIQNFAAELPHRRGDAFEFPDVTWTDEVLRLTGTIEPIPEFDGTGIHPGGETEDHFDGCVHRLTVGFVRAPLYPATIGATPAGIDCPSSDPAGAGCDAVLGEGTTVSLQARDADGPIAVDWLSSGVTVCTATARCDISLEQDRVVLARFADPGEVSAFAAPGGRVLDDAGQLDCGLGQPYCAALYDLGFPVTLHAEPARNFAFSGWQRDCAGAAQEDCSFSLSRAQPRRNIYAGFSRVAFDLLASVSAGQGRIVSAAAGLNCAPGGGEACAASAAPSSILTLLATADTDYEFVTWSGACTGSEPQCEITLEQDSAVAAAFARRRHTLTVTPVPEGVITSSPTGIDCSAVAGHASVCSADFDSGSSVVLSATAQPNHQLVAWGADCASAAAAADCSLLIDAPRQVSAQFAVMPAELSVSLLGAGDGAVGSLPAGIDCLSSAPDAPSCSGSFEQGAELILTATAAAGSVFTGWSGACFAAGATAQCRLHPDQASLFVEAEFRVDTRRLSVGVGGDGRVYSEPDGVDCRPLAGAVCGADFVRNSKVTLRAIPDEGQRFVSWNGNCAGAPASCVLTMDTDHAVSAEFAAAPSSSRLDVAHPSGGAVSGPGISCGGAAGRNDCSEIYSAASVVNVQAIADPGFEFMLWDGDCAAAGHNAVCELAMQLDRSISAHFTLQHHALNVSVNGLGEVTTEPAGIVCNTDSSPCTAEFAGNSRVNLNATAAAGQRFAGWSGDCAGTAGTVCNLGMQQPRSATAQFEPDVQALSVSAIGSGLVTSTPAGINCDGDDAGSDCSESYASGSLVELRASANPAWQFASWAGDCAGVGPCQLSMDGARTATATFSAQPRLTVLANGALTVTSTPTGISCDGEDPATDCTELYNDDTPVRLSVALKPGHQFDGWGGACAGQAGNHCDLVMDGDRQATASASPLPDPQLQLSISGNGAISDGASFSCAQDDSPCSQSYPRGSNLQLLKTAGGDLSWGGDCAGTADNAACELVMDADRTVSGESGMVQDGGKLICNSGEICTEDYPPGSVISLSGAGAGVLNWGGDCAGTAPDTDCMLTIDQARDVSALFASK